MVLGYLLLILIPVAAIAYIIWDHRRKTARRLAASADRLQNLLAGTPASPPVRGTGTHARPARAGAASPAPPAAPAPDVQPGSAAVPYAMRERLLTPPQTLLYHLLRAGLPDHLVFARMTLASVLEPGRDVPAPARNEPLNRLGGRALDFVVSDRSLKPVAAVNLKSPAFQGARDEAGDPVPRWLALAGVRYVELDATALPRKDAIREIVLGSATVVQGRQRSPDPAS